jgi:hypothetical protein
VAWANAIAAPRGMGQIEAGNVYANTTIVGLSEMPNVNTGDLNTGNAYMETFNLWLGTASSERVRNAVGGAGFIGTGNQVKDAIYSGQQAFAGNPFGGAILDLPMFAGGELLSIIGRGYKALRGAKAGSSFFSGTKYTNKVLGQMKTEAFHAFPESVTAFEKSGVISTIKGGDGLMRQILKIPGEYGGKKGFFEFIKEADGAINHRFFRPGP